MTSIRKSIGRVKSRFVSGTNRVLGPKGWQLVQRQSDNPSTSFFRPVASCQIPNLGFLLELTFGRRTSGLVVEVGAFDGESYSNSSCLIERGWSAVLVEPVPAYAALCRGRYSSSSVVVIESACGASTGQVSMTQAGALSSANDSQVDEYRSVEWAKKSFDGAAVITVPMQTLDGILLEQNARPGFEVLIVDVEGCEADVFAGFDLRRWRPQLMIWELSDAHPDLRSARDSSVAVGDAILDAGYRVLYKDAINTVFVCRESSVAAG